MYKLVSHYVQTGFVYFKIMSFICTNWFHSCRNCFASYKIMSDSCTNWFRFLKLVLWLCKLVSYLQKCCLRAVQTGVAEVGLQLVFFFRIMPDSCTNWFHSCTNGFHIYTNWFHIFKNVTPIAGQTDFDSCANFFGLLKLSLIDVKLVSALYKLVPRLHKLA